MENRMLCCVGTGPAAHYAEGFLRELGVPMTHDPRQAAWVLLDVPTKEAPDRLIPEEAHILGGNLTPELLGGRECTDLLRDEGYLAQNAAITAHCAVRLAMTALPVILPQAKTVVLGWGRIGRALGRLLRQLDTPLTITARKDRDLAALRSLGYEAARAQELDLEGVRLVINTVPAPLLTREQLEACPGAVKLDLASKKGLKGEDVLWARGLPGIQAPESSGRLIAETVARLRKEGRL